VSWANEGSWEKLSGNLNYRSIIFIVKDELFGACENDFWAYH